MSEMGEGDVSHQVSVIYRASCKELLLSNQLETSMAVRVLNLPVGNVLFSCPVLMLWSYFRIIPCH